jgi:hypothetical protein
MSGGAAGLVKLCGKTALAPGQEGRLENMIH